MSRLSPQKRAMLELVRDGHVMFGDPYPGRTARRREKTPEYPAMLEWLVCGAIAYGRQNGTLNALIEGGLIEERPPVEGVPDRRPIALTDAGRAALGKD